MGRGASKLSGGSTGGAAKAFDRNDPTTWPVGTKVTLGEEDLVAGDGVGGRGAMNTENGTVTAVYDDHVIVTTDDGTQNWIDKDLMGTVQSVQQPSSASTPAPSSITAPANLNKYVTPTQLYSYTRDNGYDRINDSFLRGGGLTPGTEIVISQPIMNSNMSSRFDPDGVSFQTATYVGQSSGAYSVPIVKLIDGTTKRIDTNYPYDNVYIKR